MIEICVTLTVNDMDEYKRVLAFVQPDEKETKEFEGDVRDFIRSHPEEDQCALLCKYCARLGADFETNPETLSFSWSGRDGYSFASWIAEEEARHFDDITFRICWDSDCGEHEFGVIEKGVVKRVEMSREIKEAIDEMIHFDIDVDPYVGPTPENYHRLHLCRWDYTTERVKSGDAPLGVSLQVKDTEEFRRVLEYVKPDESDTVPQDREEYGQVTDHLATLSGAERCGWMTRHCKRLNLAFDMDATRQILSWSGYGAMGDWAKEILGLVVAQFPEIEFRVSEGSGDDHSIDFGVSERGRIRWLNVSYDIQEMVRLGIDVDPYAGPTPESIRQLEEYRWNRMIEDIKEGRGLNHFVSLQVENHDDFHRVLEFVTPDHSDQEPQDGEECGRVKDCLNTLSGAERCAWMTRHCARLFLTFDMNEEKLQLLWSGPGVFDAVVSYLGAGEPVVFEIARMVVSHFPVIKFHVCVDHYEASFAQSENGELKWLELDGDEKRRMLDQVRDSTIEDKHLDPDLPF